MSKNKSVSDYQSLFETEEESQERNQKETTDSERESFAELIGAKTKPTTPVKPKTGTSIKAEILVMGKEDIFLALLDRQGKPTPYEGLLSRMEIKNIEEATGWKPGDTIEVVVGKISRRDGNEEIRLTLGHSFGRSKGFGGESHSSTSGESAADLEDAFDFEHPVEGRVAEVCNGGFRVALKGQSGKNLAFCPISQLVAERIETPETYIGFRGEFLITKFEEGGRNIIVSRKKLLQRESDLSQGSFLAENPMGTTVKGTVKRIENFGAFVELAPSLEGLLHISEISWSRLGHPSEVLQVGQQIFVKLLKQEQKDGKLRLSLSAKQADAAKTGHSGEASGSLDPRGIGGSGKSGGGNSDKEITGSQNPNLSIRDPFKDWAAKHPNGSICEGVIERREGFGWFVKLAPSITGLLHKSKVEGRNDISWDKWKPGEKLVVEIAEIQNTERRVSLAMPKDPSEEDWQEYQKKQDNQPKSSGNFGGAFGAALSNALTSSSILKEKKLPNKGKK